MDRQSEKAALLLAAALSLFAADAAVDVYFLRHGETAWNRAKILQGSIPYPDLTERGVRMAEETARGMAAAGISFDRIYTSPYRRARRTAETVAAAGAWPSPKDDARLREMCFGRYEGVRYGKNEYADDNIRAFFEDPARYVPQGDGAETFRQVGARLRDFLESEVRPLDGRAKRVLCVAHSLVLRALVLEIAGAAAPAQAVKTLQRNCCVHVVRYEDGRFSLAEAGRIFYDPRVFDASPGPKMVAHRGAGDLSMPEASLAAYSNAVESACDIVKLDVQFTRDGVAVTGHDLNLKRCMGWDAPVARLTYGEILERGRYLENGRPGGFRIVRLDEALQVAKPVPEFWLDFKDERSFSPECAEKALAAFARAGIDRSRVMLATFNRAALAYMRDRHPDVRRIGHCSFARAAEGAKRSHVDDALELCGKYGLYGLNMPVCSRQTCLSDIETLRSRGIWVSLWFVQNAEDASLYCDSGADAFVTDHVSAVRRFLVDRTRRQAGAPLTP